MLHEDIEQQAVRSRMLLAQQTFQRKKSEQER